MNDQCRALPAMVNQPICKSDMPYKINKLTRQIKLIHVKKDNIKKLRCNPNNENKAQIIVPNVVPVTT